MSSHTYDHIIIGAGSAGCVLADRLTASGERQVLLLEAGPRDNYLWIHIPIGYGKTMFHPIYNWGFHTEAEPNMNGRRIYWPRGRGLGGSSSINGLIAINGQREDYDAWARQGNPGWSWLDVKPYFRRSRMSISPIGERHELIEAIIAAANELGIPRVEDFNGPNQEGAGYYRLYTKNGWRSSSATAYLREAERRRNLRVETDAHATRIAFRGRTATGVHYLKNGRQRYAEGGEIILSAGALQSPQLLQLSGVGPAELLESLDIPVVADLAGVGANLQDHLQLRVMYKCTRPITTNDDLKNPWRKARVGVKWLLNRGGPLAIGINQGGLFTRVLPESSTPDVQFHFATVSAELAGGRPHPWPGFTMSVCQLRPESRGHVRIWSRDPRDPPSMQPNYLATARDRRCTIEGVKLARTLAATNSLKPYVADEYRPGAQARTDDALLDFARNHGATIFHPAGTCKMGSDTMAVVDAKLSVHGVERLRVIDCSIMPTLVSGNTHGPVVMIAEKGADLILRGRAVGSQAADSAGRGAADQPVPGV